MENLFEMYLNELQGIKPCTEEENEALSQILREEKDLDGETKKRLIEGNLALVAKIAAEYAQNGIDAHELIEEGNLALTLAICEYREGKVEDVIDYYVRDCFKEILEKKEEEELISKRVSAKVNLVSDAATLLAKELGREATVDEIAQKLGMERNEVVDAMRMALNAMDHAIAQEADLSDLNEDDIDLNDELSDFKYE